MTNELTNRGWIGEIAGAAWHSKRVFAVHAIGNFVLMLLMYLFLIVPDRTGLQVVASGLLATVTVLLLIWLHGATFAYFDEEHGDRKAQFLKSLRSFGLKIPAAVGWLVLVGLLWVLILSLEPRMYALSGLMRAKLPFIRRMFSVRTTDAMVAFKLWFFAAVIVPIVFLPLMAAIARAGYAGWAGRGWRAVWRSLKNWRWWVSYVVLIVVGGYLPYRLTKWVPDVSTMGREFASMIVRLGIAYVVATAAWMLVVSAATWFAREKAVVAVQEAEPVKG